LGSTEVDSPVRKCATGGDKGTIDPGGSHSEISLNQYLKKDNALTGMVAEVPDRSANHAQKEKTQKLKISEEELKNFFKLKAQCKLGKRV
jgi:hypothetical protein